MQCACGDCVHAYIGLYNHILHELNIYGVNTLTMFYILITDTIMTRHDVVLKYVQSAVMMLRQTARHIIGYNHQLSIDRHRTLHVHA